MDVILLERIPRLGKIGDIVNVKNGYARNFLLPQGKALRATEAKKKDFEIKREQLESQNLKLQSEAEKIHNAITNKTFIILRSSGETGQLYGSVSARDIAEVVLEQGFNIIRRQVALNQPIKKTGIHNIQINLHPEVTTNIKINVARSAEEAKKQETETLMKDGTVSENKKEQEDSIYTR
ncbi:MAG: large subunit ribosomal protein L9 [Candidatus Tokpelaia sp. JSC161]|jgi:large subunit ribosomal protein L9|nr:MAG: large subunit ribosomal protein L9 [Candidatus Tokpelaia sp. JSC161]